MEDWYMGGCNINMDLMEVSIAMGSGDRIGFERIVSSGRF
jgi:hypothetical protein